MAEIPPDNSLLINGGLALMAMLNTVYGLVFGHLFSRIGEMEKTIMAAALKVGSDAKADDDRLWKEIATIRRELHEHSNASAKRHNDLMEILLQKATKP